jgi:hypothetical protein
LGDGGGSVVSFLNSHFPLPVHQKCSYYVSDSGRKQRYEEAECASISRRCDPTGAALTVGAIAIGGIAASGIGGRSHVGTGDIGRDGKVLRECQVCALGGKQIFSHDNVRYVEDGQAARRLTW